MRHILAGALGMVWAAILAVTQAAAQTCTADDFAKAVDNAGEELRRFNGENSPKLQAKLRQLKVARGWSDSEFEQRSGEILHDDKVAAIDRQASDLFMRIDELGVKPTGEPDCNKLEELRTTTIELLAAMRTKSAITLARIDGMLGAGPATAPPPAVTAERLAPPAAALPPSARPTPPPKQSPSAAAPAQRSPDPRTWSTVTELAPSDTVAIPAPIPSQPPPAFRESDDGYTIDEIREASRGFFGTISSGLGSVIEYAFSKSGRPSAYVLGQEGGGAFLAGLRYGDGTLYLRSGGTQKIWWHGPSVGYDFGASGSRTMFLIYKLKNPADLFRSFTGVDGSAYLVGGVGMTLLTNGSIVMAPIRSGLGLRLGANVGYVRFTPSPTWNPF